MPDAAEIEAIKAQAHAEGEKAGRVLAHLQNIDLEQGRMAKSIAANAEQIMGLRLGLAKLAAVGGGSGLTGAAIFELIMKAAGQ